MRRNLQMALGWWMLGVLFVLPALTAKADSASTLSTSDPASVLLANPYGGSLPDLVAQKPGSSALKLGNSDYVATGPIIEGLRRRSYNPDKPALWKRIVLFPVYLVTPQPMASPPGGGGHYFRWREESTRSWMSVSESGVGNDSIITHEPKTSLISVGK